MFASILGAVIALPLGILGGYVWFKKVSQNNLTAASEKAKQILAEAENEAQAKLKAAAIESKEQQKGAGKGIRAPENRPRPFGEKGSTPRGDARQQVRAY